MTIKLTDLLVKEEGFRAFVYDDATGRSIKPGHTVMGHPTVGIGRCLDTNGITKEEAIYLLNNDIEVVRRKLMEHDFYRGLDCSRQMVLESMAFQMGVLGLLKFRTMIACINRKDWKGAALSMLGSQWANQTPGRVHRLAWVMETGQYQG